MSSTTPPEGPGGPEFLEPADGRPVKPERDRNGGGRRTLLVAGGAALGLAVVGGGAWAALSFFATGPQPAEALPGSTIGYASVDLDPSGGQKIEAFRMIQRFPALEKELGGLDADDDLLEKLFEDVEEECDGVSYAEDVKPWLGQRFAVAAVDLGEDEPTPVGVLQVSDADAANEGLSALQECAGSDVGGWNVDGDWAVVAETEDLADQVAEATADGTLAGDESFQRWNDAAGDPGVMSFYAAPEAGAFLADAFSDGMNPWGGPSLLDGDMPGDELGTDLDPPAAPEVPEEVEQALEDFRGMAATLRFDEGSLEFEVAAGVDESLQRLTADGAAESVASLPEDTAAALGFGLADGWFDQALEQAARISGGEMTAEDVRAELEAQTGLTGEEVETLLGDSATLAVGSDFDPETFFSSSDGSGVPVGAKIKGDSGAIEDVLEKVADASGGEVGLLGHDASGDAVAVGPDADYRTQLLDDGGLGDSEVFRNVVREADDAGAIFYVNFDAGDWLTNLARSDAGARENLEPLQGIGFSSWTDDDTAHAVFRLTTD